MKRYIMMLAVVALSFVFVSAVFAAGQAHQNTGCGLGTMLFKNNADDSILSQTFQATTNGFYGNQTFGITSGTSDCQQPKNFASNERLNEFMVSNMDNLARDIAQGRGETLDAFAELAGVPAEKRPEFYSQLQAGFARIFTSPGVQMASVMDKIATVTE
jgi:hypothetical protein